MDRNELIGIFALFLLAFLPCQALSSSGTEGAAFLDIPVGAGPAALGSAYAAQADDAYATVYNPGGLGFLDSTQLAAQHLSYLATANYEFASFVHPFHIGRSIGTSIQYVTSGDIAATDNQGNSLGNFSSHYASYNVSYGQMVHEDLSIGITGKWINAAIDNVSANAYAADIGAMYRPKENLTLAAVVSNMGSQLTFLNEGDSLPLAVHLAAAYSPSRHWSLSGEGIYAKTGLASGRLGIEWSPLEMISLRAGYRTETTNMLSAVAGFSTGFGVHVWGHELAYAWVPYGDLGNTQYLSLVLRFGEAERARRNLIYYNRQDPHAMNPRGTAMLKEETAHGGYWEENDTTMLELMKRGEEHTAQLPASFYMRADASVQPVQSHTVPASHPAPAPSVPNSIVQPPSTSAAGSSSGEGLSQMLDKDIVIPNRSESWR